MKQHSSYPSTKQNATVSHSPCSSITSFFILSTVLSFLRRQNVITEHKMRLSRDGFKCNQGIYVMSVLSVFFFYNSGLEIALGNNCLIGTLTQPKALKTLLTYVRILPQTQQPLAVLPYIDLFV